MMPGLLQRRILPLSLLAIVLAGVLAGVFYPGTQAAEGTPVYQARIINEYPHDPDAFTQGLVIVDGVMYEGTGQYGSSTLRVVDMATGELLRRRNLERRYFGEGITILDGKIYQLTWRSNVGFVYDQQSFEQISSFYHPGEGWGITHDGTSLIISDGSSALRFVDPATMSEVRRVQVTQDGSEVVNLNELEYINGEVWANVWYQDYIVRIDPETGRVNSRVDLSNLNTNRRSLDAVLNGIAWDADTGRLFVTGKLWSRLYEIDVLE